MVRSKARAVLNKGSGKKETPTTVCNALVKVFPNESSTTTLVTLSEQCTLKSKVYKTLSSHKRPQATMRRFHKGSASPFFYLINKSIKITYASPGAWKMICCSIQHVPKGPFIAPNWGPCTNDNIQGVWGGSEKMTKLIIWREIHVASKPIPSFHAKIKPPFLTCSGQPRWWLKLTLLRGA